MSRETGLVGEPRVIPCPPWCEAQDPSDEACHGVDRRTPLSIYPRLYGDGWADQYLTVYPTASRARTGDCGVFLGRCEDQGWTLTPDEARQLAEALILAAADLDAATTGGERA